MKLKIFKSNWFFQKTTQLKNMLNSKELEFIMEAHNGLSARIVEEAGNIIILPTIMNIILFRKQTGMSLN